VVNTHLVEGATRNEGDRARRSAEEGEPSREVEGCVGSRGGESNPSTHAHGPGSGLDRSVDAARDRRGPGQAFGWLDVGIELASIGCFPGEVLRR
jgi:hypothetical protein